MINWKSEKLLIHSLLIDSLTNHWLINDLISLTVFDRQHLYDPKQHSDGLQAKPSVCKQKQHVEENVKCIFGRGSALLIKAWQLIKSESFIVVSGAVAVWAAHTV